MRIAPIVCVSLLSLPLAAVACGGSPAAPAASPSSTSAAAPPTSTSDVANEATRAQRAGAIFEHLKTNDYEGARADFDATMIDALPASKLEAVWKPLTTQIGPLTSCALVRERPHGEFRVRLYDCTFAQSHLGSRVAFDSDQKVAGLFFVPLETLDVGGEH